MPFRETSPVAERIAVLRESETGVFTVSELCRRHGISRETFYVWQRRRASGEARWFEDRSHAVACCPHATDGRIADRIIAVRRQFPHFGPKKIKARLEDESRNVGRLILPEAIFLRLRASPVHVLEVPRAERVAHLVATYGGAPLAELVACFRKIEKRFGHERTQRAIAHLERGEIAEAVEIDDPDGQILVASRGVAHRLLEPIEEQAAVRQAGKAVAKHLGPQRPFGLDLDGAVDDAEQAAQTHVLDAGERRQLYTEEARGDPLPVPEVELARHVGPVEEAAQQVGDRA